MSENTESVPPRGRVPRALRLWEWFWRGEALRHARADRALQLDLLAHQRACIAAEVADQALDPPAPWRSGNAYHLAAALYLESIGWSLRAARPSDAEAAARGTELGSPCSREELAREVDEQEPLVTAAAEGRDNLARLRRYVAERGFEATSASGEDALIAARQLSRVAHNLLSLTDRARPQNGRIIRQRVTRLGAVLLAVILVVLGVGTGRDFLERRADLSVNKPWKASSAYEVACVSPQRNCGDKDYFFHTQDEQSPWLEVDLQQPQRVSRVSVVNRRDCCAERAVPLIVEVSVDHVTWREVARRDEMFVSWRASFTPQNARWVRFRVARRSALHLSQIRVL